MASARATHVKTRQKSADVFAGVRVSHPDRVLFPDEGITKRDLALYYAAVAPAILPHIVGRPLSLVRCPEGSAKPCFYQKHLGETMPEALRGIAIQEKTGKATYIRIDDLAGLISLVQMGVLEIHPWGSRADRLDRPDRLIFDIDPADDLSWSDVVQAARLIKERLDDLGLTSFCAHHWRQGFACGRACCQAHLVGGPEVVCQDVRICACSRAAKSVHRPVEQGEAGRQDLPRLLEK